MKEKKKKILKDLICSKIQKEKKKKEENQSNRTEVPKDSSSPGGFVSS